MAGPYFPTPFGLKDFHNEEHYLAWSNYIRDSIDEVVKKEEQIVGKGNSQFYNPESKPTGSDKEETMMTWNGFPRRLRMYYPDSYLEVGDKKDGWIHNGKEYHIARNQDEYLEWFVYKNAEGNITRVDFTCEAPEYWEKFFEWEPATCLTLYQKLISKDVKLEDLCIVDAKGKKRYNVYNIWNTTHGCMHLNCPPNSIKSEIQLAGDATIIRICSKGKPVTDAQKLIICSKYGRVDRNSDPRIGSACNMLCLHGKRITIGNPVCLYISNVRTSGWITPDGRDASRYMQLVRGTKEKGLRYTLQVPESENFTVGDIMIGGEKIQYGGTIALSMDISLTAEFCTNETGAQPGHHCIKNTCKCAVAMRSTTKLLGNVISCSPWGMQVAAEQMAPQMSRFSHY